MNTIWMKIAAVAVVIVVALIVVGKFSSNEPTTAPPTPSQETERPKTVYDSFDRDDKEFGVKFQDEEPVAAAPAPTPTPPATPQPEATAQTPPAPPAQPRFEKLPLEQEVEAQRFHSMALAERKRSRLPMMTPKLMVDYCRELIRRWPKSEYAFKAKLMLADIPERFKEMYKVTPAEMDVSSFYQ